MSQGPEDLEMTSEFREENDVVLFPCVARTDDATTLSVTW